MVASLGSKTKQQQQQQHSIQDSKSRTQNFKSQKNSSTSERHKLSNTSTTSLWSCMGNHFYKLVWPLWKSIWQCLRKFGIDISQDATILFLGIYPKSGPSCQKDTCTKAPGHYQVYVSGFSKEDLYFFSQNSKP